MKKILGITIGGLQHKILNLVLIVFLVTIGFIIMISATKAKELTRVVEKTRVEQQTAIEEKSTRTLLQSIESSMTRTNAMQAYIADDMFSDIRSDVMTLQSLAEGIFGHSGDLAAMEAPLPDPSREGEYTPQVLFDKGVDHKDSRLLGIAAHMSGPMTALCSKTEYMYNCYISLADGTSLLVDPHPANKYDENGELITFAARYRPWYMNAVESGGICFTGVIRDTYTGSPCVTCSAPVYADEELVGVVAIDLFLDSMEQYVESSSSDTGFICIISDEGKVVFAPEDNPIFRVAVAESSEDLRRSGNTQLAQFIGAALSERTGMRTVSVNGTEYYMAGSPMKTVGWAVVSVVEKNATEKPARELLDEYDEINQKASGDYRRSSRELGRQAVVIIVMILILGVLISRFVAGRILKPIESMTEDIMEGAKTGKMFEMKELYRTKDEIQVLAESIDDLSVKTVQYIKDITSITAEKERIGTELFLATRIQESMLPHIFPPFPERHEFDIYAMMEPAREVGGDFYDFFLVDSDHLGLVMADVSGKGIPAALFMMISKTILQSNAMHGASPAEILAKTNEALCANNQAEMFVTVWLGILEISTGKLTCANAGHEYPVLKTKDGAFALYKDRHSFAVGGMEGIKYREYTIQLEKGDSVFLYTDGVPEASDTNMDMFGVERMVEVLNQDAEASPKELLENMRSAVGDFVGDAEQFDDMTMMCIEYNGGTE